MSEHRVSLTEVKDKVGNAILLATTRNCRFVITRYGTEMGAIVGHRDLQRLKKLDDAEHKGEPAGPTAEQIEKERYEALMVSIFERVLLGEQVVPKTSEEWEIYFEVHDLKFKAQFDPEKRQLLEELTENAKARRA